MSRSYKVNLQTYLAECEANYQRLLQLLPADLDHVSHRLMLSDKREACLLIAVTRRCRYTSMLSLTLMDASLPGWNQHFELRAYHDARLLEVCAFQSHHRIKPVYTYPNRNMYQQDEKWQQLLFLSECLVSCLQYGLSELDHMLSG